MNTLKKWPVAALITGIAVLLSAFFGMYRSLNAAAADVENMFYRGVYLSGERYTEPAINAQLESRINAAMGLVTVGAHYDALSQETAELRNAREALISAKDISDKYTANLQLEAAYTALYASLLEMDDVSADDLVAAEAYRGTLSGAQGAIEKSHYNEQIDAFNDNVLRAFPVNVVKGLLLKDSPDYFDARSE